MRSNNCFGHNILSAVTRSDEIVQSYPEPVAVLGKNIWGPGPSSFGRQPRLSEITIIIIIIVYFARSSTEIYVKT